MFSLNVEKGKYIVVRGGVSVCELTDIYKMPIGGEIYEGRIIEALPVSGYCYARVGDSYQKIAQREGCQLQELIDLNQKAVIYPTKKIWLP